MPLENTMKASQGKVSSEWNQEGAMTDQQTIICHIKLAFKLAICSYIFPQLKERQRFKKLLQTRLNCQLSATINFHCDSQVMDN